MKRWIRIALLTGAAALAAAFILAAAATPASAYCVYNRTKQPIVVYGEFCVSCLMEVFAPGNRACCPGQNRGCGEDQYDMEITFAWSKDFELTQKQVTPSGNYSIQYSPDQWVKGVAAWKCSYKVPPHGYVIIRDGKGGPACQVHNHNHSVRGSGVQRSEIPWYGTLKDGDHLLNLIGQILSNLGNSSY